MSSQFLYNTGEKGTISTGREDSSGKYGLSNEMISLQLYWEHGPESKLQLPNCAVISWQ